MNRKFIVMSLISTVLALFGCTSRANAEGNDTLPFKSVEVAEFAELIADTTVVRLDVRTPEEFAEGHIEGAINIDVKQPDFEGKALATRPKDKTWSVDCRSGNRSKKSCTILTNNGYKVVELATGWLGWSCR